MNFCLSAFNQTTIPEAEASYSIFQHEFALNGILHHVNISCTKGQRSCKVLPLPWYFVSPLPCHAVPNSLRLCPTPSHPDSSRWASLHRLNCWFLISSSLVLCNGPEGVAQHGGRTGPSFFSCGSTSRADLCYSYLIYPTSGEVLLRGEGGGGVLHFQQGTHTGSLYQNQAEVTGLPEPLPAQAERRWHRGHAIAAPPPEPRPAGDTEPLRGAGRAERGWEDGGRFPARWDDPGTPPSPLSALGPFHRTAAFSPHAESRGFPSAAGRPRGRAGATLPAPSARSPGRSRPGRTGPARQVRLRAAKPSPLGSGWAGRTGRPGASPAGSGRTGETFLPGGGGGGEAPAATEDGLRRHGARRAAARHLRRGGRRRPARLGRLRALQEEKVPGRRGKGGGGGGEGRPPPHSFTAAPGERGCEAGAAPPSRALGRASLRPPLRAG